MKYTSAEAAKLLKKLNDEQTQLKVKEGRVRSFVAAVEEDLESVRPAYNYTEVQERLCRLEAQVRALKHAINTFNLTTEVPGFNMTIDQMLVYIPQLNERKQKLTGMAGALPKERENSAGHLVGKSLIEYRYTNYDVAQAQADLEAVSDELARAQTALDVVNNSATLDIDIEL